MSEKWKDEVRDIINRADSVQRRLSHSVPSSYGTSRSPRTLSLLNWFDAIGKWIQQRFSSTNEILVSAASLVVVALLASIILRQLAAVLAIVGAVLFVIALVRGILERRVGHMSRPVSPPMWRGRVIDLESHRPSLGKRVRSLWRRH